MDGYYILGLVGMGSAVCCLDWEEVLYSGRWCFACIWKCTEVLTKVVVVVLSETFECLRYSETAVET